MRWVYVSSSSFPELREVHGLWSRTRAWIGAMSRALRSHDFWLFVVLQLCILGLAATLFMSAEWLVIDAWPVGRIFGLAPLLVAGYLQVSLGGDMMRRHLRSASEIARYACPNCGHSLFGHLSEGGEMIRCPECGDHIETTLFAPPYRVPRRYRAFPPRRSKLSKRGAAR